MKSRTSLTTSVEFNDLVKGPFLGVCVRKERKKIWQAAIKRGAIQTRAHWTHSAPDLYRSEKPRSLSLAAKYFGTSLIRGARSRGSPASAYASAHAAHLHQARDKYRRPWKPKHVKFKTFLSAEGKKNKETPGICCVTVKKHAWGFIFWLRGRAAAVKWLQKECVKWTREEHAAALQSRPSAGSLFYVFIRLSQKKKKKKPFASHKQFRIQLRKHRVNHMARVARVGCIFPQTKKGLRVQGKEKKNNFPADEAVVWRQWSQISRLYSRLRLRRDMSYD